MSKKHIIPVLAMMLIVGFCASTLAGGHDHKTPKKAGIQCVPILEGLSPNFKLLDDCFYVVHSIDNRGLWPEVLSGTMLTLTKDYWQECSVLISKTYMPFG